MRRLVYRFVAVALVATSFSGCDERLPTGLGNSDTEQLTAPVFTRGGNGNGAIFRENDNLIGIGFGVFHGMSCVAYSPHPIDGFSRWNPNGDWFRHLSDAEVTVWITGDYGEWSGTGKLSAIERGGDLLFNARAVVVGSGEETRRAHCHLNSTSGKGFINLK